MEREKLPYDQMPDFKMTEFTYKGTTYYALLGRIERVTFGLERGCFITMWLHIDFGGSGQGFGGVVLHSHSETGFNHPPTHAFGDYIASTLDCFGVEDIAELKGQQVWALYATPNQYSGSIVGVVAPKSNVKECQPFIIQEWRDRHYPKTKDDSNDTTN